jgi:hypothetical protein
MPTRITPTLGAEHATSACIAFPVDNLQSPA